MSVINHDAAAVTVIVAGSPVGGWADGDFLTIEKPEGWTKQEGSDGEVARSKQNKPGGTITLTLMSGSLANTALQALLTTDELTGAGVVPISVTDLNGSLVAFSADAWISKPPTATRGRDNGQTEWVFDCGHLTLAQSGAARAGL